MSVDKIWRPLEPGFIADPYPLYKLLRERDPVHRAHTGEWVLTRYRDVREVLKSDAFSTGNRLEWLKRGIQYFESKQQDLHAIYQALNSFLVLQNPPRHTHMRALIAEAWTDKSVGGIIQRNINDLISQFPKTAFDFIEHFAQPLPVLTISCILGISPRDHRKLKNLAMRLTESLGLYLTFNELVTVNEAAKELLQIFTVIVNEKKSRPDDSLISRIIQTNQQKDFRLSDEELISLSIFLFIAGEETSSNLIGSGMFNLLSNETQLKKLRSDPTLVPVAMEELLRFDPSIQIAGRVCLRDYPIGDVIIPKGATVSLVIGSANRDPEFFTNPDVLDVTRQPNRHLTFGAGLHYCMGDWLARKQAQMAFASLLQKFSMIKFAGEPAEWNRIITFRSVKHLMITAE